MRVPFAILAAVISVAAASAASPQFVDVARQAGLTFHHTNGATPAKHLVETMGSGAHAHAVLAVPDARAVRDVLERAVPAVAIQAVAGPTRHRRIGEDARGRVYAISLDGGVLRLAPRRP